jgi:3-isopropylmalate/(R)-2-methylmalate dehydratase large subunit
MQLTSHVPATFLDKVWNDHVIADLGGGSVLLRIDRFILHDLNGGVAFPTLQHSGRPVRRPDLVFAVMDHLISTQPGRGPDDAASPEGSEFVQSTRKYANEFGITLFDVGDPRQGICHVIAPELGIVLPGLSLVCCDSHTCTLGGLGALAFGIGSTEGVHVLATQTLVQSKPLRMRVALTGRPQSCVTAKDIILGLIGKIGASGGNGYAVEFSGQTISEMSVESRLTLCNMSIEFTAKYGFVSPDDVTFQYLAGRDYSPKGRLWDQALDYWRSLPSDPDAVFDKDVSMDCGNLAPQVTWGTSPEHVIPVDQRIPSPDNAPDGAAEQRARKALEYMQLQPGAEIEGTPINAAYIGACTNARVSDLRDAARFLKGRKVAPEIQAICIPGSTRVKREAEAEGLHQIFTEAGFEWHEAGCGLCANLGNERLANLRVISTTNRNFEGRQGPLTRTHLASPATVAMSAVNGRISDPRKAI